MPPHMRAPQLRQLQSLYFDTYGTAISTLRPLSTRFVHSSSRRHVAAGIPPATSSEPPHGFTDSTPPTSPSKPISSASSAVLARLPTSSVLRSYLITAMSSSPALLSLCFTILRRMLDSKSALTDLDRNPVLARILKSTFYAQFCAGETKKEVAVSTTAAREQLGYDGIILEYALEVLQNEAKNVTEAETKKEIETWLNGMLESIEVTREGDFIGLKWSGLGRHALQLLQANQPATEAMWSAILSSCRAASAKGISLLPGAEEELTNPGIEAWNTLLQREFNALPSSSHATVYTTYQCYLRSAPAKLARDLQSALQHNHIAGIKLVRGAYLDAEKARGVRVWPSKPETDACYDGLLEAVLKKQWIGPLAPYAPHHDPTASFPEVNLILATHNIASVKRAQAIRDILLRRGKHPEELPRTVYAQLQGMADEVSQMLVREVKGEGEGVAGASSPSNPSSQTPGNAPSHSLDNASSRPKVYKCMTWGSTTECLNFLLRRAAENKDALGRTKDTKRAMGKELLRRGRVLLGLSV